MNRKYRIIRLEKDFENFVDEKGVGLNYLSGLSSVNVFIGPNNAGKSRFLRNILKTKNIAYAISDNHKIFEKLASINERIKQIWSDNDSVSTFTARRSDGGLSFSFTNPPFAVFDRFIVDGYSNHNEIKNFKKIYHHLLDSFYEVNGQKIPGKGGIQFMQRRLQDFLKENVNILSELDTIKVEQGNFQKYYIPTLRGLNNFSNYVNGGIDIFKQRTIDNYKIDESSCGVKIFTGQDLYNRVQRMLLGQPEERKRIKEFENFLSQELFGGEDVSLIPSLASGLNVLHVKIGSEERPIFELGDGIQSLIILTFPLFETDAGVFFIEEPETHLHPGMQRKLLEVLKKQKQHQYFITTHSNHFLDLTLDYEDISLYTFNKESGDESTRVDLVSPGDENMLQLLGARNTSVFLSNSTIWVEGITDRLYIRKYLEIYQQDKGEKIFEDSDYSFVEYGGDNITHWSFLNNEEYPIDVTRLCAKSMLIMDRDGEKNLERKKQLKVSLKKRYKLLSCKEIENTLSFEVLGNVINDYEKKNNNETFRMPLFPSRDEFIKTGIGNFIDKKIFSRQTCNRRGGYGTKSGTIKDKVEFCKRSISYITKDNMTRTSINLAKSIYDFVILEKHRSE